MAVLKLFSRSKPAKSGARAWLAALGGRSRNKLEEPRTFFFALLALIMLLVFWAGHAEIDQVVRVEGKVVPAGRSQQIQHLEGGLIASIDKAEGALVKKGDLLLTIDNTLAGANLSEGTIKLNSQRVKALRLEAETQHKPTLEFSPDLAALPVSQAEQSLFIARRERLNQQIAVHQTTIKQRTADIAEAEQRRARLTSELATAHQRLEMMEGMAARGAASKMEVLEAQSREQRFKTEIGETEGIIPRLKAAIAEEHARIEAGKAEFRSQAHDELVLALEEIDRLKQGITAAADRLKRTEVRAPVDGVINRITVNTVGGVVRPGDSLVELIPTTNELLIEAKAHPRDRGYLRTGLDAEIRVSAYDISSRGLLKGNVTEVSADSIQEMRGDPFYQVKLLVKALPESYQGQAIIPGMTITADIVTGRRTVLAYLLSPVRKFTYNSLRDPR
jgi:adhesin transport system membrane fusion protein